MVGRQTPSVIPLEEGLMFETLGKRFSSIINKLSGFGHLTEKNIEESLREVKLALLEADVHVGVVKSFLEKTQERVLGQKILESLKAEEQFLALIHEELVAALGGIHPKTLELTGSPPHIILMVGLQGSGKTTTTAKLARYFSKKGRRPYLVPADVARPAAIEQLKILAASLKLPCYDTKIGDIPVALLPQALKAAADKFCDLVLVDSAGRLHVDDVLMLELREIKRALGSPKIILVVDAMTGQQAVAVAKKFHDLLKIDGLILTKLDGDARGGAALSIQAKTGCPLYFLGMGEKVEDLEIFEPERLVSRLLDRGDILSLVEKAKQVFDETETRETTQKLLKNRLTLEDFRNQLRQMKKMGSLSSLLGFLPGGKQMAGKVNLDRVEKDFKKKEAIIDSMTMKERLHPELLNGSRRLRIAKGSGTHASDVNRLMKEFDEMRKMMKKFGKGGMAGLKGLMGF